MVDEVQVAGILHDIGKIIELNITGYYSKYDAKVNREKKMPLDAEYEILGTSHAELGAYLLGIWGLPTPVVEAVAFHHQPGKQVRSGASPLAYLHIANWVINQVTSLESDAKRHTLDPDFLNSIPIPVDVDSWRTLGQKVQRSFSSPAAMDQINQR
jgi:HD-like signal output (HDOD) protein